jgi:integrase
MWLSSVLEELQFRQRLAPTTIANYEVALRRWSACGVRSVGDVSVATAQSFVEKRLATVQTQSVSTEFSAVLAVLAHLERTGRFPTVTLDEVRRCAPRTPKRQQFSAPFLAREQLDAYCAGATADTAWLVRLACYVGLRASELARLEWCDVDLDRRTLQVGRGKTGARRVPLCAPAVDLLRPRGGAGHVFGGVCARTLQERVREGRGTSSPRVTLTLCRHTRASWWVQSGVPLAKVAKWLGHSIEVCARHYAGLAEAYDPAAELGAAG